MRRLIGFVVALAFVVGAFGGYEYAVESRSARAALPALETAPSFHGLVNQLGQPVASGAFRGKVQVVSFLFPYCTTFCPLIAVHLVGFEHLLNETGLQDRVQIVAYDVDPAHTGPKQMRAFLRQYGWNPSDTHWQYLTGSPAAVRRVVTAGYHVYYHRTVDNDAPTGSAALAVGGPEPQVLVANPLAAAAHVNYDITHNDALMVVGPHGRVRRIFGDADTVSSRKLLATVERLLTPPVS